MRLSVEEIAMTATAQTHKLELILEELDRRLGLQDSSRIKWSVRREWRAADRPLDKCAVPLAQILHDSGIRLPCDIPPTARDLVELNLPTS